MRLSSVAFRNELYNDNRNYKIKIEMVLRDGKQLTFTERDIWEGGFSYSNGVSESGTFTIGAAIISKLNLTINNMMDEFSDYEFDNATLNAYVGLTLANGTTEYIDYGVFTVDEPYHNETLITLSCLDNMNKADVQYICHVSFPCTRLQLIQDACQQCGLTLQNNGFDGHAETVRVFDTTSITCREIIGYVAQMGCLFAKVNEFGHLVLGWYDTSVFDENYDGGTLSNYNTGDNLDGGNFFDYTSTDSADGGDFFGNFAKISGHSSNPTISISDVCVTGVCITASLIYSSSEIINSDPKTYLSGENGYVIYLSGNPLITNENVESVAGYIFDKIGGMIFRPFASNSLSNPLIEPGDAVYFISRKEDVYQSFISNISFNCGVYEDYACDAESAGKNASVQYTISDKNNAAVQEQINSSNQAILEEMEEQVSDSKSLMDNLTALMMNSFGIYKSEVKQEDGSSIFYLHDKKLLDNSTKIWRMTADAFTVSTDGGKTWNGGFDAGGNAAVNILNAIGINADWIDTGTIKSRKIDNGDGTFVVDEQGNVTAISAEIEGNITGNTLIAKDKFYIRCNNIDKNIIQADPENWHTVYESINIGAIESDIYIRFQYDKLNKYIDIVTPNATVSGNLDIYGGNPDVPQGILSCGNINSSSAVSAQKFGQNGAYTQDFDVHCQWADNSNHNILYRDTDGLSAYLGWSGTHNNADGSKTEYQSAAYLRGKTIKLRNSSGAAVTSDERLKNSFTELDKYDTVFENLVPCAFKYNDGTSGRFHFGFKAQDVKSALIENGFTTNDFAGFVQMADNPESEDYCGVEDPMALIYSEFTAWNTHMIQKYASGFRTYKNVTDKTILDLEEKLKHQDELIKLLCEKAGVDYGN